MVPTKIIDMVKEIYKEPKFRVKCGRNESEYMTQESRIRQGCPLSPYLFVIVMSAMIQDIKNRLNTPKQHDPIYGIEFAEILCR